MKSKIQIDLSQLKKETSNMSNLDFWKIKAERKKNINLILQQISLVDLASEFFGIEPHGKLIHLHEHPSCVIKPSENTFQRYSTGAHGNVFDFLQEFHECGNLSFNQAYNFLLAKIDPEAPSLNNHKYKIRNEKESESQKIKRCHVSLNQQLKNSKDSDARNTIAYLIKERKIDSSLVFELLERNHLFQLSDQFGKKAAFLGYDPFGFLSSVCFRACSSISTFKGDFKDCNYDWGWFYTPDYEKTSKTVKIDGNKNLVCFESYVDMLSYITLLKKAGQDTHKNNYLSCGSIDKAACIFNWQEKYDIKNIVMAFDNDERGKSASSRLEKELIKRGCHVINDISEKKDWNEQLKYECSMQQRIESAKNKVHDRSDKGNYFQGLEIMK